MKISINQLQWHDAKIVSFALKSIKDSFDLLTLTLESEAFLNVFGKQEILLVISNCYKVRADLNLWITGKDSILKAEIKKKSSWIDEEKRRFVNGFGPPTIFHFEITTNTNSKIEALLTEEECIEVIN